MASIADLGVNPRVCLCGGLQLSSMQTLDLLDIGEPDPDAKRRDRAREAPKEKILVSR